MKKILIINGHPDSESFSWAIADAYAKGARAAGAEVQELRVGTLPFELSLLHGYRVKLELEPCLVEAQEKILWADHLVWIFPTWWGTMPAVLKGFIDRVFLPGFAFSYHVKTPWPLKLLKGKSARIITTVDTPVWYYKFVYARPGIAQMQKAVFRVCGISPSRVTIFGSVRKASPGRRAAWLKETERLGERSL